jgi:transcription elongation GreA/GreB family factor
MQKNMVETARMAIREAQENANTSEDSMEEGFVSYREQLQHTRDMYTMQLQTTQNDLETLQQVPAHSLTLIIEAGAIVHTDKQNFFIAVSIGKVTVDNKTYFPISTSAPIFQAMVGLKKGDSFQFRDRQYKIQEVF